MTILQFRTTSYKLILDKQTPQGVGSALTYAKRQILQAMFGLSAGPEEDDDGNEASLEDEQFEDENPGGLKDNFTEGKLTSVSAFQIAKVALQEINTLEGLEEYWKAQPETIRTNPKVVELFKTKGAELKLAIGFGMLLVTVVLGLLGVALGVGRVIVWGSECCVVCRTKEGTTEKALFFFFLNSISSVLLFQ